MRRAVSLSSIALLLRTHHGGGVLRVWQAAIDARDPAYRTVAAR